MKQLFFFILAIAIIYSCSNSSASSAFKKTPNDTSRVIGVFELGNSFRVDYIFRIAKDTLAINKKDSTQLKWQRDTLYYAPFLDTVRINGAVQYDSTKVLDKGFAPKMQLKWVQFPQELIYQIFEKPKK
jgi:hypothetical protein